MSGLTEKERRFVEAYMGEANGNGAQAAILAGYSPRSAKVTASRMLTRANVRAALDARADVDPLVGNREERQRFYTEVMRNPDAKMADRLKAAELQGKTQGDFIKRIKFEDVPAFRLILEDA